jgi:sulfite reductase (NADPH) hemoprotein beta-component
VAGIKANGLATPNIGLLTDMICCPGGDFCSLANAKSLPIAAAIAERFDRHRLPARHRRDRTEYLRLHQRLRPSPRRQHRRAGRRQGRQRMVSGVDWRLAGQQRSAIGKIIGPSFSALQMPEVIGRLLQVYVRDRTKMNRFVACVQRLGIAPVQGICVRHADQERPTGWRR